VPLRCAAVLATLAMLVPASAESPPAAVGLDHIPIAVANEHAKFADGTELELITAPEARDALTTTYRQHLAHGDGPAFLALYAPSIDAAAARIGGSWKGDIRRGPFLYLGEQDGLGYLFLGPRNASPTDRPEHFAHANGASSLVRVWLAGDLAPERRLLESLGAVVSRYEVHVPGRVTADVAHLPEGDVVLLPADRQLVAGRKIVGATLRVAALAALEAVLARSGGTPPARVATPQGTSIVLPPDRTHGLWLEFRETRPSTVPGR
jgi:hypothetical protein